MDNVKRPSMMDHFFKMLRLSSNTPTEGAEEENAHDVDEPPDHDKDTLSALSEEFRKEKIYQRAAPQFSRRESLLTRAIRTGSDSQPTSPMSSTARRGLSTTSSHSFASTAELTSDGDSLLRSASPSPPPPANRIRLPSTSKEEKPTRISFAAAIKEDNPTEHATGEAAVEKTLGRKRCIMFACAGAEEVKPQSPKIEEVKVEAPPRKSRLTFICPGRQQSDATAASCSERPSAVISPSVSRKSSRDEAIVAAPVAETAPAALEPILSPLSPQPSFHEFASSHDEIAVDWVQKADEVNKPKLTIDDCWKKESAIRQIGREAEEEADAEEREQEELDEMLDDEEDAVDDFAPSDDEDNGSDDGGNESDDENGFADSDDESEEDSEYQFWAPATTTAATSADNLTHISSRQRSTSRASSTSSLSNSFNMRGRPIHKPKGMKFPRMRPGTPELPDSTDFVCGTLDEDRPLEAAYISCREMKRREKHVLIPQDIDPSFPTSDPEDEDEDENDEIAESAGLFWMKDNHFENFDDNDVRGRRRPSAFKVSPLHSPTPMVALARPSGRPAPVKRTSKSPPPPKRPAQPKRGNRSPAPKGLFDHTSRRCRSPPPTRRLCSPRGSPTNVKFPPLGITINRLAQRPTADRTASLPHTPNPFFRNWQRGSPPVSIIRTAATSPQTRDVRSDMHVRGPVDIVIGLEKKRQKRKEKFWRQHCRKTAKEHAEKKPLKGRGVERMKELGLECAERKQGYGLGQQAQLVLSL